MMHFRLIVALAVAIVIPVDRVQGSRQVSWPETFNPNVPVEAPDPQFPLRVHLLTVKWGGTELRNHGYGMGNLLDPNHPQGFDFAFECNVSFVENRSPDDVYQARWKHEPYQLEILTSDVGGKHRQSCTLHLAMEPKLFTPANSGRYIHGVSSSLRTPWTDPDFADEESNPNYPVRFHVLDAQRTEAALGDRGWGTANVLDPDAGGTMHGADFQYECVRGFLANSQLDLYYQGRWIKPAQKLQVLLRRPGYDAVDKCVVSVAMKSQPYVERRPQS